MTSLLSTVRRNNGPRPIKTTTSQALMDSHHHQRYGINRCPQILKIVSFLAWAQAILFFGHHQEPREGLYLHEAQELAEVMMKTTTWMGQPAHQQVFPIMIAKGRQVISMSRAVNEH